jgi:hypothetical protein
MGLAALLLLGGCNPFRAVEKRFDAIEQEISSRPEQIEKELAGTFSNMAQEDAQYRKCLGIVSRLRGAETSFHSDFNRYTGDIAELRGGNDKGITYVEDDVIRGMDGVCYILKAEATDKDYRMLLELDKKSLSRAAEKKLANGGLSASEKTALEERVRQLKNAKPCQITATAEEAANRGECGFEKEKN